jgi:ubiquinone/menaquinone biosynthesis C-methylase UbiE
MMVRRLTRRHKNTPGDAMRDFWDQRARENAMWYIHSELDYRHPDPTEFWRSGARTLALTLDLFGVGLEREQRVLEIGCGVGRMTRAMAPQVRAVVGLDVAPEMIERGRLELADLENVELVVGNGRDLSQFGTASFDVCYSFIVFQHIPDPEITCSYIREMGRVLKPKGWALFQISESSKVHSRSTWERTSSLKARLAQRMRLRPSNCLNANWLGSALSREQLLDALAAGGLRLDRTSGDGTQFCFVLARKLDVDAVV